MANKGARPNRRAASKTHFFKYQLAGNPNRAEESDLKRALQESLLEQFSKSSPTTAKNNHTLAGKESGKKIKTDHSIIPNSTRTSDSSELSNNTNKSSNNSGSTSSNLSNKSAGSIISATNYKRTRSSINNNLTTNNSNHSSTPQTNKKRAKTNHINNNSNKKTSSTTTSTNTSSSSNNTNGNDRNHKSAPAILIVTTNARTIPATTQTTPFTNNKAIKTYSRNHVEHITSIQPHHHQQHKSSLPNGPKSSTPIRNNIGRVNDKVSPTNQTNFVSKSTQSIICPGSRDSHSIEFSPTLLHHDTANLSINKKNQNQSTNVKVINKRLPQGSWSLLGIPEEKTIYMREDEPPKRLICYPAIKHVEGDVIQVRDSVLLRSGARKTDLPYIAKVCSFWEDAETGNVMMSLFWYYRPEHTEEGRKSHHLVDEIFASRHRDVDSVECIEDKCYVLTFNEYCRYRKRCKMEQVNTTWSLTDVTIPVSNELYPRKNRIPDSDVNPELVFCCRQIYDSRSRKLVKNPLINPKYGHI